MLKGFNCTIFAYGQTGTGKTFTMEGNRSSSIDSTTNELEVHCDAGIIPRAAYHIFSMLEKSSNEYTVRVSFLELYNEELVDLLGNSAEGLKIFEDNGRKGVTVHNLEEVPVNNAEDIFKILDRGFKKRQTAETNLNKNSRYNEVQLCHV
jgi:kinesin family protein 11